MDNKKINEISETKKSKPSISTQIVIGNKDEFLLNLKWSDFSDDFHLNTTTGTNAIPTPAVNQNLPDQITKKCLIHF